MAIPTSTIPSYEEVKTLHRNSDVDENPLALHHTLGTLPNQASPGDHTHNGKDSLRIKFSDLEGGWFNIDGGRPDSIYTSIPEVDGGGI